MRDRDQIRVTVDAVDRYRGSVSVGLGTDDTGRRVIFLGDVRMLGRIQDELDSGTEPVVASVPVWAVLPMGNDPEDASA